MTTSGDEPAFVFILGTGRCGSTLLQEVLSRHPEVGFVSNVDNALAALNPKGRFNNPVYRGLPSLMSGRTTRGRRPGWGSDRRIAPPVLERAVGRLRLRFAPSEGYRLIERWVSPDVAAPDRDLTAADARPPLGGAFRRFFRERAAAQDQPVFLHHFTGWPRAGFIRAALPGSRFVHVVRDGRAVAASLVRMPWWRGRHGPSGWGFGPLPGPLAEAWEASARSLPVLAGLQWRLLIEAADVARAGVPAEDWLEVRYEDVVSGPRRIVEAVLAFMGRPWSEGFETQFRRCSFPRSRLDAFREELPGRDLAVLDEVLSAHLARFGYAVGPARTAPG